jgi:uncharacterized protein YndB with AHSA1/START domain
MTVRRSVTVSVPAERAFQAFTEEIGQWWPLAQGFAFLGEKAKDMILEGRVGGRLYERGSDGTEHVIGEVRTYEPPSRVLFTWNDSDGSTEVEVRFTQEDGATRVDLEHRGFESLGPKADEAFNSYNEGWVGVLGFYEKHAA